MALIAGVGRPRRGAPVNTGGLFGYQIAPNEQIWRGGLIGITSAGYVQRIQTSGCVAFVGLADRDYNNLGNANPAPVITVFNSIYAVIGELGTYQFTVEGAIFADIKGTVYAVDDDTVTVTNSGGLLAVGMLAGFEQGNAYVKLLGA